jgi:glycosyltransferase domain-containing protein
MTINTAKLTLLILVHDNQYFLERCFDYLKAYNLSATILDSSEASYSGTIPNELEYIHTPGEDYWNKVYSGMVPVKSEFVALLGVDDFFYYNGICQGMEFLEMNPDYVSVAGDAVSVNQIECGENIEYRSICTGSHGVSYDEADLGRRLRQMKRFDYPIYYNIIRTKVAVKAWFFLTQCKTRIVDFFNNETRHFIELLTYVAVLLQGKHANIKRLFWLRDAVAYSGSGDITYYNYQSLSLKNPTIHAEVYKIAAEIYHTDIDEISDILDKSFQFFSTQSKAKNISNTSQLYDYLKNDNFLNFVELDSLIRLHRTKLISAIQKKLGRLPKFYDKYGPNWVNQTCRKLNRISVLNQYPVIIYGAGEHTRALFEVYDFELSKVTICDSNKDLWGKYLLGCRIIPPHEILQYSANVLVSSQNSEKEIITFLNNGFQEKLSIHPLYT